MRLWRDWASYPLDSQGFATIRRRPTSLFRRRARPDVFTRSAILGSISGPNSRSSLCLATPGLSRVASAQSVATYRGWVRKAVPTTKPDTRANVAKRGPVSRLAGRRLLRSTICLRLMQKRIQQKAQSEHKCHKEDSTTNVFQLIKPAPRRQRSRRCLILWRTEEVFQHFKQNGLGAARVIHPKVS